MGIFSTDFSIKLKLKSFIGSKKDGVIIEVTKQLFNGPYATDEPIISEVKLTLDDESGVTI